jgi:uncharacterized membrane protein
MSRWYFVSIAMTVLVLGIALILGLATPAVFREKIPTHWDIDMQPDAWTTRQDFWPTLLIFPGVMGALVFLMWVLPMLSPRNFEVERFGSTWCYVMLLMVGFFAYLFALQVWIAVDEHAWFARPFVAGFFVLFALLGNVIGKVQRNFWMGVRTPWTLASDAVWVRTHRMAAWTWMPVSIVGATIVLLGAPYWIAFVLLVLAILWPALYSLILYKRLQRDGKV